MYSEATPETSKRIANKWKDGRKQVQGVMATWPGGSCIIYSFQLFLSPRVFLPFFYLYLVFALGGFWSSVHK